MYSLLVGGMVVVVLARNAVLFLIAWEIMSVASYFLVIFHHEKQRVRRAGLTYLVATHIGTAFLLAMFVLLGGDAPVLDFDRFQFSHSSGLVFIFALVGFGTKAGFMPLHVWLPEAHPSAPSHVSALMSGVMIKTGIYGLIRILSLAESIPTWWGGTVLAVGALSGVLGVIYALAQHDLKRLLAYHSVENIGIIALGIGVGLLGMSWHSPALAVLGMTGALFHVLNHSVFKGLLFLGAGAVGQKLDSLEMDSMGGLARSMPVVGTTFLIGSVAIVGLPPLNGFASEFLIYLAAASGVVDSPASWVIAGASAILSLALIGGLAALCFTKVFGVVFLGTPRSPRAAAASPVGWPMRASLATLALTIVMLGLGAPEAFRLFVPAALLVTHVSPGEALAVVGTAASSLRGVLYGSGGALAGAGALWLAVRALLRRRRVRSGSTWGCGYARGTPRMQYTSASYAQPVTDFLRVLIQPQEKRDPPEGIFPQNAGFHSQAPDVVTRFVVGPIVTGLRYILRAGRWLQQGQVNWYVLYIMITVLVLLLWNVRP